MITKENIICFSTVDWDFLWQSQHEIMYTLARNGNRILFIDNTGIRTPNLKDIGRLKMRILNWKKGIAGIRKESENLYVYSPIIFPFPYSRLFSFINKLIIQFVVERWMRLMYFSNPIVWVYLPTQLTRNLVKDLDAKVTIYYSVDDFVEVSQEAKRIKKSEERLLCESDVIFTTSRKRLKEFLKFNNNAYFFPDGLSNMLSEAKIEADAIPVELKGLRHPILGYVGGIHKWVDQDLISYLAEENLRYSIVMIGPIQCDISKLSSFKNIFFLGRKEHCELKKYINFFDACIIPYRVSEYTNNSYPNKAIEYMAFGKPVISTNLEEFKSIFNKEVYFADNYSLFSDNVEKALKEDNEQLKKTRIDCARANSWQKRIEDMSMVISDEINKKIMQKDNNWKEIMRISLKKLRLKIVKFLLLSVALYLIIFYTPFIWLIAGPLKLDEQPRKAEAIVVFAGGVGESGKAGQGYEERVQRAADLYKEGYAKNIIFSSGYTYVFKEPEIMKALAVSLGVPADSVILEEKAVNTYENVQFIKDILKSRGWSRVLLVSSPYHMLRASLVFKKNAPGLKVICSPITNSRFYMRKGWRALRQINLEQIKGIIHEYLGIIYYWRKGWI